jgi:hypothetical protein
MTGYVPWKGVQNRSQLSPSEGYPERESWAPALTRTRNLIPKFGPVDLRKKQKEILYQLACMRFSRLRPRLRVFHQADAKFVIAVVLKPVGWAKSSLAGAL